MAVTSGLGIVLGHFSLVKIQSLDGEGLEEVFSFSEDEEITV